MSALIKSTQDATTKELKDEIKILRGKVDAGVDNLGSQSADTTTRVREMEQALEDIQEKLWELDKSWKNNLVFYGVKADAGVEEHPSVTESKIRDVIRQNLQITREVPIIKVRRTPNGPTVRGSKPITVCFERWGDKDEILRKANLLRGSNIYVGEDFSKKVRDQRAELQKFLKLYRRKRPAAKFSLHFDKLFIDNEIYVYNEVTGQVEQVTASLISVSPIPGEKPDLSSTPTQFHPSSGSSYRPRKKSSGKQRLEKSYSTESSLNHLVPSSPVHPRSSRQSYDSDTEPESQAGSPVKSRKKMVNGKSSSSSKGSPKKGITSSNRTATINRDDADDDVDEQNGDVHEEDEDNGVVNDDEIVADYKKINTYDGPLRKMEPDIPETIPE